MNPGLYNISITGTTTDSQVINYEEKTISIKKIKNENTIYEEDL